MPNNHTEGGSGPGTPSVLDAILILLTAILVNIGEFGKWVFITQGTSVLVGIVVAVAFHHAWKFLSTKCILTKTKQWRHVKESWQYLCLHCECVCDIVGVVWSFCCVWLNIFFIVSCTVLAVLECFTGTATVESEAEAASQHAKMEDDIRTRRETRAQRDTRREDHRAHVAPAAGPTPPPTSAPPLQPSNPSWLPPVPDRWSSRQPRNESGAGAARAPPPPPPMRPRVPPWRTSCPDPDHYPTPPLMWNTRSAEMRVDEPVCMEGSHAPQDERKRKYDWGEEVYQRAGHYFQDMRMGNHGGGHPSYYAEGKPSNHGGGM